MKKLIYNIESKDVEETYSSNKVFLNENREVDGR